MSREVRVVLVSRTHSTHSQRHHSAHVNLSLFLRLVSVSHTLVTQARDTSAESRRTREIIAVVSPSRRNSTVTVSNPVVTATCWVQQLTSAKVSDIIISSAYFYGSVDKLGNSSCLRLDGIKNIVWKDKLNIKSRMTYAKRLYKKSHSICNRILQLR